MNIDLTNKTFSENQKIKYDFNMEINFYKFEFSHHINFYMKNVDSTNTKHIFIILKTISYHYNFVFNFRILFYFYVTVYISLFFFQFSI